MSPPVDSAAPTPWVHVFLDVPAALAPRTIRFWSAMTGYAPGPSWAGHPEFTTLSPGQGSPYLHVQTVDADPRVHLDLVGDLERDPGRLERLGASRQSAGDGWQVMRSPAGLPFCVCGAECGGRDLVRPPAARWATHRSRIVQVCVDVPHELAAAEHEFWQAATGWPEESTGSPEFRRLVRREHSPLQLLVQRLGADDPREHAEAHLDLGTDDPIAEAARALPLGARLEARRPGITVFRDPAGLPFCITGNDPDR